MELINDDSRHSVSDYLVERCLVWRGLGLVPDDVPGLPYSWPMALWV
jgi:hypothetical protein